MGIGLRGQVAQHTHYLSHTDEDSCRDGMYLQLCVLDLPDHWTRPELGQTPRATAVSHCYHAYICYNY